MKLVGSAFTSASLLAVQTVHAECPEKPINTIIAFVPTPVAVSSFRQSLILSNDGWLIFFQRPVAMAFIGLAFVVSVGRRHRAFRVDRNAESS